VSTCQFTDRAFDGVALLHPFFERFSLLLAPPLLQKLVMLTDYDGAMRLVSWHTLRAQRTTSAMGTPLEAVNDLASGLVNAAALGALKTARTAGSACGNFNIEGLDPIGVWSLRSMGAGLGWPDQLPALVLSLSQPCRRHVGRVYVEFSWPI